MADEPDGAVSFERHGALVRQNHDLARRLADYEYRSMRDALLSGDAFVVPRLGSARPLYSGLPSGPRPPCAKALSTPLARIAAHRDPGSLPSVGVIIEDSDGASVQALLGLAAELNARAFARVLFLTRCLTLIPFLSRYGFPCQGVGSEPAEKIGEILGPRLDLEQIRDLKSGRVLWRR